MPNHVHALLHFVETRHGASLQNAIRQFGPLQKASLSVAINLYKGSVVRLCRKNGSSSFYWQSRFHDRIIRDKKELENIREYIISNPKKWREDDFFV
ncbi:MAG: transposase [Parcubacteria group bacterium Gr01-1014_18]|nr:MAG: transposase [Parcubacteria group bacterium Greene0416_36]TSC81009.1 MAG: transposase [Parcubacteria group bacterium Gr01-1014_18]TSC98896.1 MAG: transposase [Parcubacteria group bacterium Greene1014_20]TSD06518.1 MAG: transposase [Parcubacteria group bacterium Greene0714_2]